MSDDTERGGQRTAYRYDEKKNPDGGALPGVPLRALTVAEVESYPPWLQRSIRDQPFYTATQYAPKVEEPKARVEPAEPLGASPEEGGPPARRSRKADEAPAE